ncbi:hypothetical protein ABIF69_004430 [Bradyrhizobium japonicum]
MQQGDPATLAAAVDSALARLRAYIPPGSSKSYAFALACALVAGLFECWLMWLDQNASPLIAYYPAVVSFVTFTSWISSKYSFGSRTS